MEEPGKVRPILRIISNKEFLLQEIERNWEFV